MLQQPENPVVGNDAFAVKGQGPADGQRADERGRLQIVKGIQGRRAEPGHTGGGDEPSGCRQQQNGRPQTHRPQAQAQISHGTLAEKQKPQRDVRLGLPRFFRRPGHDGTSQYR